MRAAWLIYCIAVVMVFVAATLGWWFVMGAAIATAIVTLLAASRP